MCKAGGAGADGWFRLDEPGPTRTLERPSGATRGPAWAADLPRIVREATPELTLFGAPGGEYSVVVGTGDEKPVTLPNAESTKVQVDLTPGFNKVCARVVRGLGSPQPEAQNCVDIVYLR
jgi:hypothetical protein